MRAPLAPDPTGPSRVWTPLASRSFRTLFAGYAISAIGDGMAGVAISWLAIDLAHGHGTGLLVGAA
ncbi:MAG: MFS transporter, partial [Candidatus Dormibacteria bacterium]